MSALVQRIVSTCAIVVAFSLPARAEIEIKEVTSPGGIKAWLVEEHSLPFIAVDIAFRGGTSLDAEGKRGAMNLMSGEIVETGARTGVRVNDGSGITYSNIATTDADKGLQVNVGIRPEDFVPAEGDHAFSGKVHIAEALGEVTLLYFAPPKPDAETATVIAKMAGIHKDMRGQTVNLTADPSKVHLFHNGQSLVYR